MQPFGCGRRRQKPPAEDARAGRSDEPTEGALRASRAFLVLRAANRWLGSSASKDEVQVLAPSRNNGEELPALLEQPICTFLARNSDDFQVTGSHAPSSLDHLFARTIDVIDLISKPLLIAMVRHLVARLPTDMKDWN